MCITVIGEKHMNYRFFLTSLLCVVLGIINPLLCRQPAILQDENGNSYIYVVASKALCGYITLINKAQHQLVLEAFLYAGNTKIKAVGRYEWADPQKAVQFSFDSAGVSSDDHYRLYCYPRYGEQSDRSDCITLLTIDFNNTRTRAACTTAAPWAGGRGNIPFKPLCMDELYHAAECADKKQD